MSDFSAYVVEQLSSLGDVSSRKMFGGVGIFESSRMFALITSDGQLCLKVDDSNRPLFESAGSVKHGKMPYFSVPDAVIADANMLRSWAKESIAIATAQKKK